MSTVHENEGSFVNLLMKTEESEDIKEVHKEAPTEEVSVAGCGISQTTTAVVVVKRHRPPITAEKIVIATAMFAAGQSPQAVAIALSCSISKAYQIKKDTEPRIVGQPRQPYTPKTRGRKSKPQVKEARQQIVKNLLTVEPDLQQAAVAERLPHPVHQSTICRDIQAIGWTRKVLQIVPFDRNTPALIQERRKFAEKLQHIRDDQLIYVEETWHNLYRSTSHGYSATGAPAVKFQSTTTGRNLTGIVAISCNGLLHVKLVNGAADGGAFRGFVHELEELLPQSAVVAVDDVPGFHHSHLVHEWALQRNPPLRVEYLPSFSQELTPFKEFVNIVEATYRKKNRPISKTQEVMRARVEQVYEELRLCDLSSLYNNMRQFLALAYASLESENGINFTTLLSKVIRQK